MLRAEEEDEAVELDDKGIVEPERLDVGTEGEAEADESCPASHFFFGALLSLLTAALLGNNSLLCIDAPNAESASTAVLALSPSTRTPPGC